MYQFEKEAESSSAPADLVAAGKRLEDEDYPYLILSSRKRYARSFADT